MPVEKLYPKTENIGKDCAFWDMPGGKPECNFLNAKLAGRDSCKGVIDDICLFQQGKIPAPEWLSREQVIWLVTTPPSEDYIRALPRGKTVI